MIASTIGLAAFRPNMPRWLLGRLTSIQLAGIVVLAAMSVALSVFIADRNRDARSWVHHTREVQLAIDKVVWDLLELQQAMRSQRLNRDTENVLHFNGLRTEIRKDIRIIAEITADNPYQQQLQAEFEEVFAHYLINVDRVAASDSGNGVGRSLAPAMSIDANRMSALIAAMRNHEDGLLQARSARADDLLALLLPTLCVSAALLAILVVMAAQSINRAIRERDCKLSEKERELAFQQLMMREVDHRVRNSLGLVYNLMTFQQKRAGVDETTRRFLAEAANQILVVARVHERLYRPGAPEWVPIGEYLSDLCDDVAAYSLPAESRSAIRVHAVETDFPAEQAIWLGLIVVEFVTNALKYGSPALQAPILIDVAPFDGRLRIVVSDQGRGLPENFDPQATAGLGMQIVGLLVKQLQGTLGIDRTSSGARFVVTVPVGSMA